MAAGRKGTKKLAELLAIEQAAQERWEREGTFQVDAPAPGSEEAKYGLLFLLQDY